MCGSREAFGSANEPQLIRSNSSCELTRSPTSTTEIRGRGVSVRQENKAVQQFGSAARFAGIDFNTKMLKPGSGRTLAELWRGPREVQPSFGEAPRLTSHGPRQRSANGVQARLEELSKCTITHAFATNVTKYSRNPGSSTSRRRPTLAVRLFQGVW
ncbi:hypothetical protein B0H14DRAFT_2594413 [Mycena olivaceomarginata]|nr:hypothetical protein B0H14DRAFT_2594413 [Mycena olivaceomarginata]